MINNYIFDKKLIKNNNGYCLELIIPYKYNNFFYKIYGSEGFYSYGRYSSFNSINTENLNHKLIINIDNLQNIFINIILKENKTEYYDFLNMNKELIDNYEKNIKMNIKKIYNNDNNIFLDNLLQNNQINKKDNEEEKDSDEDDEKDSDEDDDSDDEEDKDSDDEEKDSDDEEEKDSDDEEDDSDDEEEKDSDDEKDEKLHN